MTPPLDGPTRDWLAGPDLARLWQAVRNRLERNGLSATGSLRLTGLTPAERRAVSLLLGRPVIRPELTLRLADLDTRLRSSAANCGLVDAVTALGPPLTDHRAARESTRERTAQLWARLTDTLQASPLADQEWAHHWLAEIRRAGLPGRQQPTDAAATVEQAIHTLTLLFSGDSVPRGRSDLATEVTGTAHGLDDGTWLARLVQRGIALAHGTEPPEDASARRALWRLASVTPDEVSSTVLTYGLHPTGGGWREAALRERARHRAESHLTLREIRALQLTLPSDTVIRICENPRVVEAAADSACTQPLVCTSGSAATVVLDLLDALAAAGCAFTYHGDFDWPGIALANRIIRRYDACSWRMETDDYERLALHARARGIPPLPLEGPVVEAQWDADLAPAMDALGVALHEEAALELLVDDLA
ncbi:TIGR02679 family protein [Streptomyces sp. NPDC051286]|uniref:TIGR02679 family protein n=1 Tax=Streptomyces sp. NPDC051286 TaxID=3365647 RepID=UPI00378D70AD